MTWKPTNRRAGEGLSPLSIRVPDGLQPESALACAILRQVLIDIGQKRPTAKKVGGWISLSEQLQALEFVVDQDQIEF